VQLGQQPEQRLRQHGEPAVVLDQFEAGRELAQLVLFLRAGEQARVERLRGPRGQRAERHDHADRVLVGVDLAREELARPFFVGGRTQQPGAREIVLHHRDPAVVGGGVVVGLVGGGALLDVLEVDLLELGRIGVDRRAGEGEIEARLAGRRVAVAYELVIQLRHHRHGRGVDHVVPDRHHVAASLEGVGLDQLDAADLGRLELDLEPVLAVLQRELARHQAEHRQVIGQRRAALRGDQAGLRLVEPAGRLVEQHDVLVAIGVVGLLQQFEANHRAPQRVDGGLDQIGRDVDLLRLQRDAGRSRSIDDSRRWRGDGRRQGAGDGGRCRTGRRRATGHGLRHLGPAEQRGLSVVLVPRIPQQDERHREHHPQQGATHFGHEYNFSLGTGS
jgi:hypothetical protein